MKSWVARGTPLGWMILLGTACSAAGGNQTGPAALDASHGSGGTGGQGGTGGTAGD